MLCSPHHQRYKWLLYKHAYQRLRNEPEADDIIHELFSNLCEKRATLNPQTNLAGYLYTAVRNRTLNLVALQQVQSGYISSLQSFMDQAESATGHLLREHQPSELIDKEIATLPPKMREVFELSRKAHLSHKEIAEKLDLSEKTVKSQVLKTIVPYLSTERFTGFSWKSARSSTYRMEGNDKEVAVQVLKTLIKKIRQY